MILGTALHTGIEQGVDKGLEYYSDSFPVLTDDHIHEMMKLKALVPKASALLPPGGKFEVPISNADFIGFIDYLVPVDYRLGDTDPLIQESALVADTYDLYDFKYSANERSYLQSGQLHEYKYWFEKTNPGKKIRNLYFLFVPKVKIKQKKTETLIQFRDRLQDTLKDADPHIVRVEYDPLKIVDFLTNAKHMIEATDYPRNPNHFCGWCEIYDYCMKGWDYMTLPENKRRDINAKTKKVIWIYGAPFSGKTYFANSFPDPLMLNTDGNIKFVDAPYIAIRDEVTVEGRLTKRRLAYDIFKDAVEELEKKQNEFKTIVVDLLEDVYESCRVFICDRQGWKHESDDSFRSWDMVTGEFLNTMKRLVSLDYENIILISHEDRSRDLTRKTGDKISSIRPNLREKIANKIAGMVDVVARIVADGDDRVLSFKSSEVIFGGGRLSVRNQEIPLTYEAFCAVYDEANNTAPGKPASGTRTFTPPDPETADSGAGTAGRRSRRPKADVNRITGDSPAPEQDPEKQPEGTWEPGGNAAMEQPENDAAPWEGDESEETEPNTDPVSLPKCPHAEQVFQRHRDNPNIPLCPSVDAGYHCHKGGGTDDCPFYQPDPEPAPMMGANPPARRTRKKREANGN